MGVVAGLLSAGNGECHNLHFWKTGWRISMGTVAKLVDLSCKSVFFLTIFWYTCISYLFLVYNYIYMAYHKDMISNPFCRKNTEGKHSKTFRTNVFPPSLDGKNLLRYWILRDVLHAGSLRRLRFVSSWAFWSFQEKMCPKFHHIVVYLI